MAGARAVRAAEVRLWLPSGCARFATLSQSFAQCIQADKPFERFRRFGLAFWGHSYRSGPHPAEEYAMRVAGQELGRAHRQSSYRDRPRLHRRRAKGADRRTACWWPAPPAELAEHLTTRDADADAHLLAARSSATELLSLGHSHQRWSHRNPHSLLGPCAWPFLVLHVPNPAAQQAKPRLAPPQERSHTSGSRRHSPRDRQRVRSTRPPPSPILAQVS